MTFIFDSTIVELLKEESSPGAFSKYAFRIKPTDMSFISQGCSLFHLAEESYWETIEVVAIPGSETEEDLARRAYEFWKQKVVE